MQKYDKHACATDVTAQGNPWEGVCFQELHNNRRRQVADTVGGEGSRRNVYLPVLNMYIDLGLFISCSPSQLELL